MAHLSCGRGQRQRRGPDREGFLIDPWRKAARGGPCRASGASTDRGGGRGVGKGPSPAPQAWSRLHPAPYDNRRERFARPRAPAVNVRVGLDIPRRTAGRPLAGPSSWSRCQRSCRAAPTRRDRRRARRAPRGKAEAFRLGPRLQPEQPVFNHVPSTPTAPRRQTPPLPSSNRGCPQCPQTLALLAGPLGVSEPPATRRTGTRRPSLTLAHSGHRVVGGVGATVPLRERREGGVGEASRISLSGRRWCPNSATTRRGCGTREELGRRSGSAPPPTRDPRPSRRPCVLFPEASHESDWDEGGEGWAGGGSYVWV